MKSFHFAGTYNGDPDTLIGHEHEKNYVPFKEIESMNKLALVANGISLVIFIVFMVIYFIVAKAPLNTAGVMCSILTLVPHEFLHALCFKEDVYMYNNLKKGMLFVTGPGTFSKAEFIFMSLLPNLVFGFIPFILFLINPSWTFLGSFGLFCIAYGAGDYYNVFNALSQMPEGSRAYMHGMHTYWYLPDNEDQKKK